MKKTFKFQFSIKKEKMHVVCTQTLKAMCLTIFHFIDIISVHKSQLMYSSSLNIFIIEESV